MTTAHQPTPRSVTIRELMEAHVSQRPEKVLAKYGGKTATNNYRLDAMLEKGIKVSHQIAVATHIVKGIHSGVDVKKTSNLRILPNEMPSHPEIGSHLLPPNKSIADTTGNGTDNAATYELYLLLDLRFEGKTLCQWLEAHDLDTLFAFAQKELPEEDLAPLVASITNLMKQKNAGPATDTRTRQVYWLTGSDPTDDAAYHLLAPLYPTALVHAMCGIIHEDRFGDSNKNVRKARSNGAPHAGKVHDYPSLAIQKLGGGNPQNISHLNSQRSGINYLLSSLPPRWKSSTLHCPKDSDEVWTQFLYFKNVRTLVKRLADFLLSKFKDNMKARMIREGIEQALGAQLAAFSAQLHDILEPGWTRDAQCELDWSEQLWLDPQRAELPLHTDEDESFQEAYHRGDWPDAVAGRFAAWLNDQLRKAGLTMVGDTEYLHWARQAVIDVAWPIPMHRRAPESTLKEQENHV